MYAGGGVHAAMAARHKRLILEAFRRAKATTPSSAKTLEELDIRHSVMVRSLVDCGALVEKSGGRYYLDEKALAESDARARRLALIVLSMLAFIGLMLLLALSGRRG